MRRFLLLVALIVSPVSVFGDDLDFSALKYLAVQKDGRKKPLETVAIETVQKLTGSKSFTEPADGRKREPMDVLISMWLQTRDWEHTPVILVTYKPLKELLGLPVDQKYFSYSQLVTPKFEGIVRQIAAKSQGQQKPQLTHQEREADTIHQRMNVLTQAVGLDSLAVVPHPTDPKGAWLPVSRVAEYYGQEKEAEAQELVQALGAAYANRDPEAFTAVSGYLSVFLRDLSPAAYPSLPELRREVYYNAFHPFRKALVLYAIVFVWMLATWRARKAGVYWAGFAAFLAGVLVHGYGFYLRIMISGRPPITNMYESVVWVSFGAALFALILEAIYRQRYYIVGVAPLSVLMLLLADQVPAVLDASIGPLVPVLRSNYWLSVHVPTITLGYAAFAVAMGVGHIALGYYIFSPQARAKIERLEHLIYRAMQIGVLLLAAGTILGGIWAQEAWGRFWGWDPKETWALIALLSYLIPLHGRLAGWLSNFALSVSSVVCFLAVLMAWYGVNFVLGKGLHSYGFGVGGFGYVLGFVVVELAFVGIATLRRGRVESTVAQAEVA